jgi:hypothetical protein
MNIDNPLILQPGGGTAGVDVGPGAATSIDEVTRRHRFALGLLQQPTIQAQVFQWLMAMPGRSLQWLWTASDPHDSDPSDPLEAFAKSCSLLAAVPVEPAELTCAEFVDRLDRLINMLHLAWRRVPPGLLKKMLLMLPPTGSADRLLELQLQHVADWSSTYKRRMSTAPKRDWTVFVSAAMKRSHHDEIHLRTRNGTWEHPFANLRVAGFDLIAVCSDKQLAEAAGHKGALCSSKVADACTRGTEAWWLVKSALGVPVPENRLPVDAAVSLIANADGSWSMGPVLAPPDCQHAAIQVARSLSAQAEVSLRRQQTVRMALPDGNQLPGIHDALVALLAQQSPTSTTETAAS